MELPELRGFPARRYEIETADVCRRDRNLDIAAHHGLFRSFRQRRADRAERRSATLPKAGRTAALADARQIGPQAPTGWTR